MVKKNKISLPFYQSLIKRIKKLARSIYRTSRKNQRFFQSMQLTFIYFFATVVLLYTVKNSLGMIPDIFYNFIPFLSEILNFPLLKILAAPEKTFILYLLILEVLINRSLFNFSLLVKFNVLLVFILEMFQNLFVCYWDLLFSRELETLTGTNVTMKSGMIVFFTILFAFFFLLYLYSYTRSLQGQFPSFPGVLKRVTDSVAFWLQIKPSEDRSEKK